MPTTVKQYLDGLPADRRAAISAVRDAVNAGLPKGYQEGIQYGMIGWSVPHSIFPDGYHCDPKQPLPFASLASQKNHMALYLMCIYGDERDRAAFEKDWAKSGKKLDMGKSCVRFKRLEDVPLEVVTAAVARVPVERFVAHYRSVLATTSRRPAKKAVAKKAVAKKAVAKKAVAKKAVAKKAVAKKAVAKKAVAKKAVARTAVAKKTPAEKVVGRKTVPKRVTGRAVR